MKKLYQVVHNYCVDGGFGDAVPEKRLLSASQIPMSTTYHMRSLRVEILLSLRSMFTKKVNWIWIKLIL